MACQAASWIPNAVATILRSDRTAQPIIAWLTTIRDSTEEYDPLITVKPDSADSEDSDSSATTPDSAFDEILSQLGKEIYKLDEYQKHFGPSEQEVSLSILNIFDECLERFENGTVECCEVKELEVTDSEQGKINGDREENSVVIETNGDENSVVIVKDVNENGTNGDEYSDCESTLSEVSFATSTPAKCDKVNVNAIFYQGEGTPVPPRRTRLKTPSSSSSCYDNTELKTNATITEVAKRLDSESDSESTCWSYKECSDADDPKDRYAMVWSHSSGFHNSDEIMRRVLSLNHAAISRLSFDTASDFTTPQYSLYALHEVGDRCEPVATMTPGKPDDGYEPVRDALTTDENIYEEIEFGCSYTDEGCSCGGSVEVESCSVSASSEGVGRDSPLYANLRDHDAYAITPDVIYWKNLLLDPFYNEDEEDEWISPEESVVYTREVRPPLVIPRITQYRPPRRDARDCRDQRFNAAPYEDYKPKQASANSSVRQYERHHDWSPSSERTRLEVERGFSKANSDSPPFQRLHKKMSGSSENLLGIRRPTLLHLPASSSDSIDVEVRDTLGTNRTRKSKSMVAAKRGLRSPVPTPRMLPDFTVVHEGPVKRTKFFENGKKSRKNWIECYMVLTQTGLYFYKDHRTYNATKIPKPPGTPPSPTAPRPEMMLGLQNAHVIQCIQAYTRRYARSLELTINYDRYLIQDETEDGAKRWLMHIQSVIYSLGPPINDNLAAHYQSSNTDLESLGRTPPATRQFRSKQKAGGSSNEDLSDSTEASTQKSHISSRLRKFFAKRPPMEVLVKRGIYKDEPVFGKRLSEVCLPDPANPGAPLVPTFVKACISEIESSEENMCTDGLYRASGNLSQVQKIRLEIDQNNLSVIEYNTDIHVLTGSLKLFFRELKEPLIPCKLFDRILSACSIKSREAKIKEFREIIQSLEPCNRDTLKYLLEHLLRVTQYSERNRMHTANLAIVFGPTLLWAPAEQAHNIAIDCIQQNNVVDTLLTEFKEIFAEDNKGRRKS